MAALGCAKKMGAGNVSPSPKNITQESENKPPSLLQSIAS